jgi:hypothetical protein
MNRKHYEAEAVACAALAAFEPLIDLCLDAGVSSPELESLLRAVFVHRARVRLSTEGQSARASSDVRVALATGVHRNFVHQILAKRPRIPPERAERRHRAERLLEVWYSQPRYLDNSSQPRELLVRAPAPEPSFAELVRRHMPGVAVGAVLDELRRAGAIQLLPDDRVRVRSRTVRATGINVSSVNEAAQKARDLLDTMLFNMRKPAMPRVLEEMAAITVERSHLPALTHVISKRARTFVQALERELTSTTAKSTTKSTGRAIGRREAVKVGLTMYSWEK